jgi:hypothetical protein
MRRLPGWWLFLQVASVVLTVAGAVLIFTGPVALGAGLLIAAQPMNVFLALRKHAVYLAARRPSG